MLKKILILIFISVGLFILLNQDEEVKTSQYITQTGYLLSIEHSDVYVSDVGDGEYALGYVSGISLFTDREKEDLFIDFDYRFENDGDDTFWVSDTGAGFPPQSEELIHPLTDEYEKVGEWLGYNLYIQKEITEYGGVVYQEVFPGQITSQMTLLSKDKSRVNYYDRFIISYDLNKEESLEMQYKEFVKILESMEITPIEKPE